MIIQAWLLITSGCQKASTVFSRPPLAASSHPTRNLMNLGEDPE